MSQVTRRPLAEADILEIWDYIADDNPAAADRWVDRLDGQFRMLATQPKMGRAREELAQGVRSFPFGRYVVFYVPIDDGPGAQRGGDCLGGNVAVDADWVAERGRQGHGNVQGVFLGASRIEKSRKSLFHAVWKA